MTPTISRDPPNTEGQGQLCANLNNERQATRTQFHLYADDGQTNIRTFAYRYVPRRPVELSNENERRVPEEERERRRIGIPRNEKIDSEKKRTDGRSEAELYQLIKNLEMKLHSHRPQTAGNAYMFLMLFFKNKNNCKCLGQLVP